VASADAVGQAFKRAVMLLLQVCVVQFSNDTRVEVPLGPLDKPAFDTAISTMVSTPPQQQHMWRLWIV
jgi:hypothetical protein